MMPRSEAAIPQCPRCHHGQLQQELPPNPLPRYCLQCGFTEDKPLKPLPLVHGSLWKREPRAGHKR